MSAEYSVEEVRDYADAFRLLHRGTVIADMLTAYADTLSKPADSGRWISREEALATFDSIEDIDNGEEQFWIESGRLYARRPADSGRAGFAAWVSSQEWFKATLGLKPSRSGDEFADPCINSRWQGWQAAIRYRDEQEKQA